MKHEVSVWRDGDKLVMLRGAELPYRCIKTNNSADQRVPVRLLSGEDVNYLILFLGLRLLLLPFWPLRRIAVDVPISQALLAKFVNRGHIGKRMALAGFPLGLIGMTLPCVLNAHLAEAFAWPILACIVGGVVAGCYGGYMMSVSRTCGLDAERITKTHAWIEGAGTEYLSSLPFWPGEE